MINKKIEKVIKLKERNDLLFKKSNDFRLIDTLYDIFGSLTGFIVIKINLIKIIEKNLDKLENNKIESEELTKPAICIWLVWTSMGS